MLSAATARADRQGAIRHAEAGASVAGQRPAAADHAVAVVERLAVAVAVAGIGNRSLVGVRDLLGDGSYNFLADRDI